MSWWILRKKPEPEYTGPKYRIIKEEWPNGKVKFFIEEYASHYACDDMFWLPVGFSNGGFDTHEEASAVLTKMLTPEPKPIITVVEER